MKKTSQDEQYWDMNAGVHRRPPPLIGNPAIAWQKAYWKPDDLSDEDWLLSIEFILREVFSKLLEISFSIDSHFSCQNYNDETDTLYLFRHKFSTFKVCKIDQISAYVEIYDDDVLHDTFIAKLSFNNIDISVRVQVKDEYCSTMLICDFSKCEKSRDLQIFSISDAAAISKRLSISNRESRNSSHSKKFISYIEALNDCLDFLENITIDRYHYSPKSVDSSEDGVNIALSSIKTSINKIMIFIERSIFSQANYPTSDTKENRFDLEFGKLFANFLGISLGLKFSDNNNADDFSLEKVSYDKRDPIWGNIDPESSYEDKPVHQMIDALWPVIKYVADQEKIFTTRKSNKLEYTINLFSRHRSMYASSLGQLPMHVDESSRSPPLVYLLVSSHCGRWQIGRLVERLHDLGLLRLASTRDIKVLGRINNEIRILRDNMERLGARATREKISRLDAQLDDGIQYRVEKSRQYVRGFENTLRHMDIARIEGYRPYDQTVERRLYDRFEFVDRVGIRYANFLRDWNINVNLRQTDEIKNLLDFAEWASIVPITYYLNHVFESLAKNHLINEQYERFWLPCAALYATYVIFKKVSRYVDDRRSRP